MSNHTCMCCEKQEEQERLRQVTEQLTTYSDKRELIQALHMAQGILGYLPLEAQATVAATLEIPLSEVSGVVSFYSHFTPQPRGKHIIRVCLGTACYVRGGKKIADRLCEILDVRVGETTKDRQFTLEVARCIGACGLAPAISIDDKVYKQVHTDKLEAILEWYYQEEEQHA